jgi:hypothetical protein
VLIQKDQARIDAIDGIRKAFQASISRQRFVKEAMRGGLDFPDCDM